MSAAGGNEQANPLRLLLDALDALGLRHHLGGSYASTIHGIPRQTLDADLVVDLPARSIPTLADRLRSRFYLDDERMRHAVVRKTSFNVIDLSSGFKIDLFVRGDGEFDRLELRRSVEAPLPGAPERTVPVKSPEDTVLRKLQWYREGGEVSDRQWKDVLGVLKVQGDRLDRSHLDRWAAVLGVDDLLEKARSQTES